MRNIRVYFKKYRSTFMYQEKAYKTHTFLRKRGNTSIIMIKKNLYNVMLKE